MKTRERALGVIKEWWETRPPVSKNSGLPALGTLNGALVLLENLQDNYVLDIQQHLTEGQAQIRGAGKARTREILQRLGKENVPLEEGGRTNRGLVGQMKILLSVLQPLGLDTHDREERNQILQSLQLFLVQQLDAYSKRKRITFPFRPEDTAWQSIHDLLEVARETGRDGPIAQYIVGAKLALRFPDSAIRNDRYSSQDFDNPGDFAINDTSFHVTIAPTPGHYEKCERNIAAGFRPYLLVPDKILFLAKRTADSTVPKKTTVQSIEAFVSQNIDELSSFSKNELRNGLRRLLNKYNERVDAIETDKSLLIELPRTLLIG